MYYKKEDMIKLELNYIYKVVYNSTLYTQAKIRTDMLIGETSVMLWAQIGKILGKSYSQFIPRIHFSEFATDSKRNTSLVSAIKNDFGVDVSFSDVGEIIDFVDGFKSVESKFETLEQSITERYKRDLLISIGKQLLEDAQDMNIDLNEIARKSSHKFDMALMTDNNNLEVASLDEMIENEIINQQKEGDDDECPPTGIQIIDEVSGGVRAPATIYPLAASKVGKSTILYDLTNKLLEMGRKVLFVTIEIGIKEAQQKLFSNKFGVEYNKIAKRNWETDEEKQTFINDLKELQGKYKDQLFIMYDRNGVSPKTIETRYNVLKKAGITIDDIAVDYLGLLQSDDESGRKTDSEKYRSLPKEVRILSQKTNTRVFIPHQLHNTVKEKYIEEIFEDDIYYCKTIGHEATAMFVLHRQSKTTNKNGMYDSRLMMKYLPSRIEWTDEVFVFPENNQSILSIGDAIPIDMCPPSEKDIKKTSTGNIKTAGKKDTGTVSYGGNSDAPPMF